MPSKSPAQARLMAAAAHTKGGYDGVPQSVGREFNQADKGTGMLKGHKPVDIGYAAGGPVLGRTRDFMKEPDEFREDGRLGKKDAEDQAYAKTGRGGKLSKETGDKSEKPVKPRK